MPFDPSLPANNAPVLSAELRNQFNGLKSLLDAQGVPVGCVLAYLKSLPGVPALPSGWAECNGQVLSDAQSPLNGVTLPNLNGAGGGTPRFLRGASASGGTGGAESHTHAFALPAGASGGVLADSDPTDYALDGTTQSSASLPSYYEVVWVLRVK